MTELFFLLFVFAAFVQLYFGSKYREIFSVDSKKINKSYSSMIFELLKSHPVAGRLYVFLIASELIALLLMVVNSL